MAPLIVMLVSWIGFRLAGAAGMWTAAGSWTTALRFALAVMFVFTAASHFVPRTRGDLVRMVPPGLPNASLLVTVTGLFELLGASGLLMPAAIKASAYALMTLLLALFPANIYAARNRLVVAGRPATPLVCRLPMQLFWIGALWWVATAAT